LLGIILAYGFMMPAQARDITGKVMAVYLEPVTVNTKVMDKVSVSVKDCATGQWETASYSPGYVSDDNSLGFLYNNLANAARSMATRNQFMNSVSGHVMLSVNENKVIQKTTFWGYNWECGQDLDSGRPSASPVGNTSPVQTAQPQPAAKPTGAGAAMNTFRRFGF
jgi:hypothetical protein